MGKFILIVLLLLFVSCGGGESDNDIPACCPTEAGSLLCKQVPYDTGWQILSYLSIYCFNNVWYFNLNEEWLQIQVLDFDPACCPEQYCGLEPSWCADPEDCIAYAYGYLDGNWDYNQPTEWALIALEGEWYALFMPTGETYPIIHE